MKTEPGRAYIELITGSVLFGLLGVFVYYLNDIPTGALIFYKQLFGLISLFIYIVITGKLSRIIPRSRKRYLLFLGIINTVTLFSYFTCIKYTSFSVAILMLYTAPVYVTLLSPVVLKEKITRRGVFALVLSLTGLLFIVDIAALRNLSFSWNYYVIGIAAGILSGMSFGTEIVTIRYLKDDYSSVAQLFWYTFIGVVLMFPFVGTFSFPAPENNLLLLIVFGVVNTAMAALLYVSGISRIRAQTGSILALLEPVSGIFFDYTLLHTPLMMNTFAGCVFILLGAYVAVMEKSPAISGRYFRIQL